MAKQDTPPEGLINRRTAMKTGAAIAIATALGGGGLFYRNHKKDQALERALDELERDASQYPVIHQHIIEKSSRYPQMEKSRNYLYTYDYSRGPDETIVGDVGDIVVSAAYIQRDDKKIQDVVKDGVSDARSGKMPQLPQVKEGNEFSIVKLRQAREIDVTFVPLTNPRPWEEGGVILGPYSLRASTVYLYTQDPEHEPLTLRLQNTDLEKHSVPSILVGNKNVTIDLTQRALFSREAGEERKYSVPYIVPAINGSPEIRSVNAEDAKDPGGIQWTLRVNKAQLSGLGAAGLDEWVKEALDQLKYLTSGSVTIQVEGMTPLVLKTGLDEDGISDVRRHKALLSWLGKQSIVTPSKALVETWKEEIRRAESPDVER